MLDRQLLLEQINPQIQNKKLQISQNEALELQSMSVISKYNLFVRCYNRSCNRLDEKTLCFIQQSPIFNSFVCFLSSKWTLTLFFSLCLIPILNMFLMSYTAIVTYKYFKGLKIYRKNQKRIGNPMSKMKYEPGKCSQLKKNFHFVKISFKTLKSEFKFKQNTNLVQSEGKSGNLSQWMIYNSQFASYYSDLPKFKSKFILIQGFVMLFALVSSFILLIFI